MRQLHASADCEFHVADFMVGMTVHSGFDAVFDRGCFHSFATTEGRGCFARRVSAALKPDGLWIDVSGSANNGESPEEIQRMELPRLSMEQIADAVEPFFEIVEGQRAPFGTQAGSTDFEAFVTVLRRRPSLTTGQKVSPGVRY